MALHVDLAHPLRSFELSVALEVGRETLALVGPSGAGKTTVLHAVAGLFRPARGRIVLDGETLFDAGGVDLPPERRRVGLVFQRSSSPSLGCAGVRFRSPGRLLDRAM